MRMSMRAAKPLTFALLIAAVLWTTVLAVSAVTAPAITAGLQLRIRTTNRGPLPSSPENGPASLASTTQFLLYVHNSNPLANFNALTIGTPSRAALPNAYVLSSMDETSTVDGAPYPAGRVPKLL